MVSSIDWLVINRPRHRKVSDADDNDNDDDTVDDDDETAAAAEAFG